MSQRRQVASLAKIRCPNGLAVALDELCELEPWSFSLVVRCLNLVSAVCLVCLSSSLSLLSFPSHHIT